MGKSFAECRGDQAAKRAAKGKGAVKTLSEIRTEASEIHTRFSEQVAENQAKSADKAFVRNTKFLHLADAPQPQAGVVAVIETDHHSLTKDRRTLNIYLGGTLIFRRASVTVGQSASCWPSGLRPSTSTVGSRDDRAFRELRSVLRAGRGSGAAGQRKSLLLLPTRPRVNCWNGPGRSRWRRRERGWAGCRPIRSTHQPLATRLMQSLHLG
jgi:hypothetical protein